MLKEILQTINSAPIRIHIIYIKRIYASRGQFFTLSLDAGLGKDFELTLVFILVGITEYAFVEVHGPNFVVALTPAIYCCMQTTLHLVGAMD